jgi:hypothetical protein
MSGLRSCGQQRAGARKRERGGAVAGAGRPLKPKEQL